MVQMNIRPRTVSQRMLLITAVALSPALLIGVGAGWTVQSDRTEALHDDAYRAAELAMLELAQIVTAAENVVLTAAAMPVVKRRDRPVCSDVLAEVVGDLRFLSAMAIFDADGSPRCLSGPAAGDGFAGSDLFAEAWGATGRVVGAAVERQPRALPVARRIGGAAGAPPGVAVAFVDLDWLQAQMAGRGVADKDSLTVIDRAGVIVARVPQPERFIGTKVPETAAWLLAEPAPGTVEITSQDGERRVLGYFPAASHAAGLYVSAGRSVSAGMAVVRSVAATSTIVGVGGAVVTVLLAIYLTQVFINQPVRVLTRTVSAWRRGDSTARTGMTAAQGEICAAGETLDGFMQELEVSRAARLRAEADREMLRDEADHRVRNLLATVQAIVRQTFAKDGNEAAQKVFSQRLQAINAANALLNQGSWQSAALRGVVEAAIAPFAGPQDGRFTVSGPDVMVQGSVVVAFSIALHELCTNAAKYGALSGSPGANADGSPGAGAGTVSIRWGLTDPAAGAQFFLRWQEAGGPPVVQPSRAGFGSKVIKAALASYVGGTVEMVYDPAGLVCVVQAPRANVVVPAVA